MNFIKKYIRIADSLNFGLRVVHEHETSTVVNDSENERKLHKGKNRAEKKTKAEKTKKAR